MTFRLGKQPYEADARTLKMVHFLDTTTTQPSSWNFDSTRKPFPIHMWGNDQWGDCVLAGRANHTLRLERVEHKTTPIISDQDVINEYKTLTGSQSPGDANDNGLVVLRAMQEWRSVGWPIHTQANQPFVQKIDAYGELDPSNLDLLKKAMWMLNGIHIGLSLPITAQAQFDQGVWDVVPNAGSDGEPGSWGGHLVFAKRYNTKGIYCLSWAKEVLMTNAFIEKYCD